jgi:hypothetical protein
LAEALAVRGSRAEALAVLDHYDDEAREGPADAVRATSTLRRRIIEAGKRAARESTQHTELVGRTELVQEISVWMANSSHGVRVFALAGEAGIGKTRLLSEAVRIAAVQGMRVVEYRPSANDEERPLAGLLDLLPRFLAIPGAVGCNPDSYSRLTELARGVKSDTSIPENTTDSAVRFATLRRSVLDLVDAIQSEVEVLLSIDDAHGLDRPTVEILLDATGRAGHRFRILAAMRPTGSTPALLESRVDVRRVRVSGLDAASARQIVSRSMSHEVATKRAYLIDWAVDLAAGNPFFLVELSVHCSGDKPGESLPPSLQIAIERKLDGLSPTGRLVVQACAVLGQNSSLSRLEIVLGLPPHSTIAAFSELDSAGLIGSRDGRLGCRHDLIAEAVLRGISGSVKQYLNRRCAVALDEELKSSPVASLAWDCARHWRAAGEDAHALELTCLISDQLLSLGLPQAAAELSADAIRYCESNDQRADQLLRLSRARKLLHDWDGVIACLTERQSILQPHGNRDLYGEAETTLFEANWWRSFDMQVLRSGIERVLDTRAPTLHRLQMAVVALVVAHNFSRRGASRRLANVVESLAASTPREHYEKTTAQLIHHAGFGDIDKAVEAGEELVALSRQSGSLAALIRALRWASAPNKLTGNVTSALALLTEAHDHAVRLGLDTEVWNAVYYIGYLALDLEDRALANEWRRVFEEYATSERDPMRAMSSSYYCARLALMDQDVERASAHAVHARQLSIRLGQSPLLNVTLLSLEVALQMAASDKKISEHVVRRLRRLHLITRNVLQDFEVAVLARAMLRNDEKAKARALLDSYIGVRRSRLALHSHLRAASADLLATTP